MPPYGRLHAATRTCTCPLLGQSFLVPDTHTPGVSEPPVKFLGRAYTFAASVRRLTGSPAFGWPFRSTGRYGRLEVSHRMCSFSGLVRFRFCIFRSLFWLALILGPAQNA